MFDFVNKLVDHKDKVYMCLEDEISNSLSTVFLDLVSGVCNHNCIFCDGKFYEPDKKMFSSRDLELLLKDFEELEVESVIIVGNGGESTMHPEFANFSQQLLDMGIHVGLYTNGGCMNDESIEVACKFDFIRVSLDSGSNDVHERVHGCENNFEVVCNNIQKLKEKGAVNIGVSFIVMNENIDDVYQCIEVANTLGVDFLELKPCYSIDYTFDVGSYKVMQDKIEEIFIYINENYNGKTKVIFNNQFKSLLENEIDEEQLTSTEKRQCYTCKLRVVVSTAGCFLCTPYRGQDNYSIGTIGKNTLKDLWFGSRHKEILERKCDNRCTYHNQNEFLIKMKNREVQLDEIKELSLQKGFL